MSNRGSIMSEEERVELLNWVNSTIMPNTLLGIKETKFRYYDLTTNMVPDLTPVSTTQSLIRETGPPPSKPAPGQNTIPDLVPANYPIHPLISVIKQRIIDKEGVVDNTSYILNQSYHDFIGIIPPGGYIHKHMDLNEDELIQGRFNVFLQLPTGCCNTYYGDAVVDSVEGCYVFCPCGLYPHWSNPNTDNKDRIILSFAFLIPKDQVLSLIK